MLHDIPADVQQFMSLTWDKIKPQYDELMARPLNAESVEQWLLDWTHVTRLVDESGTRLRLAHVVDTTNDAARDAFFAFIEGISPNWRKADNDLNKKLIASGLEPAGFEIPLRNMRGSIELFREDNLPLFVEETKLSNEYSKIISTQSVDWRGEEKTIVQMDALLQDEDRMLREEAWTRSMERQLQDREPINDIWSKLVKLRTQIAENAGFKSYRDFAWINRDRYDYTPQNCYEFQDAIEQVVVPAAQKLYERKRERLGVTHLRPWDLNVDTLGMPALKPFGSIEEFESKTNAILASVDPVFGDYFQTMRHDGLLELDNRKGKSPGGFCTSLEVIGRPYIFMNAVGMHGDVNTLLHEAGHGFHVFETQHLKYSQQSWPPMEFAEVASMTMELLASPYLEESYGGYYSTLDAARARSEHLEKIIFFWPYMAVVDGFQQWVYENQDGATDAVVCDAVWGDLWDRFMVGVDWTGFEDAKITGWHRKRHIFRSPFYYVEYGLAQLGAVQIWNNALQDRPQAITAYRNGLALGGTATLPELFATAGAKFAFDAETIGQAVNLIMGTIDSLETELTA